MDAILSLTGLLDFQSATLILPLWMMALWLAFTTTLNLSLHFLSRHKLISAAAGAVQFGDPHYLTLLVLAIIWAAGLPLLLILSEISWNQLSAKP